MTVPWLGFAVIAGIALVCLGLIFGTDKRNLARRRTGYPDPDPTGFYRQFVEEKRRSPSRYDQFQARLISWLLRLDAEPVKVSPEAERLLIRLLGARGLGVCLLLGANLLVAYQLWDEPTQHTEAQASFDLATAKAPAGSFEEALAAQMTHMRGRFGYEIRSLRFEPRRIEWACSHAASTCVSPKPNSPEQAWTGDLTWEEIRPGWSRWYARSCRPRVLLTAGRQWTFDTFRRCTVSG